MQGSHVRVPRVSVGMPVHNGELFLSAAIESILGQTFGDLELIISDNASDDATEDICRRYLAEDDRVRYVRTSDNRGAMWNFREVFRQSTGPFYKSACHDDLHHPAFLQRCLEVFEEAPSSVVLVYPRTQLIDASGEVIEEYEDRLDLRGAVPHERLRSYLRNVRLGNAQYGLHRRRVYASTEGLRSFVASDLVLLAELALRGEIWELPEPLFYRRDHAGRSEHAHSTYEELAQWYDPNLGTRLVGRRSKLFAEMLKAVAGAPLPASERARCTRVVFEEWGPRYGRVIGGEIKQAVTGSFRR